MSTKWIVRAVLGAVLLVVVLLALLDFRVKSQATATAEAWLEHVEAGMHEADLAQYLEGSPETETVDASYAPNQVVQYTWPGIIRSYRVDVTMERKDMGDGRLVIGIDGPIND